jgi:hypothetical protein
MTINIVTGQDVKDQKDLERAIDDYITHYFDEVRKALYQWGRETMNISRKQCPINTGRLRASRRVSIPRKDTSGSFFIDLSYNTDYAVRVHENLEAYHKPPTKAKYLEDPVRERLPHLQENIIKRINRWHEVKK